MNKALYDMVYLVTCGIHKVTPDKEKIRDLDLSELYKVSRRHLLEALVGMTLKSAGVELPKVWLDAISKAVRKTILFDAERAKIFAFMESKGIWYLPLKGIIFKDFYPAVGMRQMSDNDILFDATYANELRDYMVSEGYESEEYGEGNHDVYKKAPIYNFEMHRALYSERHNADWEQYYSNVKERLILDEGSQYGYHFSDEDFYIYILTHEHKHYTVSGTGLRSLLDVYVYLKEKEATLDFAYIEKECEKLGIKDFEQKGRELSQKVFAKELTARELSAEEQSMLEYYLSSGVYGYVDRKLENRLDKFVEKTGSKSKFRYVWERFFPPMEIYRLYFPFFYKHKWLLPIGWFYRLLRGIFVKQRRTQFVKEMEIVKKTDMKDK